MTRTKKDVTYDCLYMENEYVELCIVPEFGGRLLYAVDKTNGYSWRRCRPGRNPCR